jgi:hypothetical protein
MVLHEVITAPHAHIFRVHIQPARAWMTMYWTDDFAKGNDLSLASAGAILLALRTTRHRNLPHARQDERSFGAHCVRSHATAMNLDFNGVAKSIPKFGSA